MDSTPSFTGTRFVPVPLAVLLALATNACDTGPTPEDAIESAAITMPTLNTYVDDHLEVDRANPAAASVADANLFTGPDPADGSASHQRPSCTGGDCTYIDWNDLCATDASNHLIIDPAKSDSSAFPRSDHCVAPAQVLGKQDLTYVAAANNSEFAYFAVQRRNNNGDSAYYWLFTREPPDGKDGAAGGCNAGEYGLFYDITGPEGGSTGDVLLAGQFSPSGGVALRVFHAVATRADVNARAAIDYDDHSLWAEVIDPNIVGAVNTSDTRPGMCGRAGVDAQALTNAGDLEPELFAEAAVPLSVFTGASLCGATFYGSVVTRPSGSGGTSPDLKDLAGPGIFHFGDVTATGAVTPTCGRSFGYALTGASDPSGNPIPIDDPALQCSWTFTNGATVKTASTCSGMLTLDPSDPNGTYVAQVNVSVPFSSGACGATGDAGSVAVFDPLAVEAQAVATCNESFGYSASMSGGSGQTSLAWTFSGPGSTTPSASTSPSGTVMVGSAGPGQVYTATLSVVDGRTDVQCSASSSATANPLSPIVVDLALQSGGGTCPSTDAATYSSVVAGGTGTYFYDWTMDACDTAMNCTVDPSDSLFCGSATLTLAVDDVAQAGMPACGGATSETETYSKVTTVTVSDNP